MRSSSSNGRISRRSESSQNETHGACMPPRRGQPTPLLPQARDPRAHPASAEVRKEGMPIWFTLDAGPNPVLLTDAAHLPDAERIAKECGARDVVHCHPGGDTVLIDRSE